MIYFDACYIAKFYLDEPDSSAIRSLALQAGEVACSLHGRIEVLAAFHRKLREGAFGTKAFGALTKQFELDCAESIWEWLPVSASLIAGTAAAICQMPQSVFIRAADALHLKTAAENAFSEIYSNDRHLLAAAAHFGLKGVSIK